MKKLMAALLAAAFLLLPVRAEEKMDEDTEEVPVSVFSEEAVPAAGEPVTVAAPSAILMEKETGTVLLEKNADEKLEPASVTKVMTILLIAEAVDSGALKLEDTVTVSARAASMGGSQVFLEEGERMSAGEMLKCIVVSSANDAAVAMAEHLAGSEEAFAARMNERAAELGMANSHFTNCTGLLDSTEHRTTARDIALMARELILNHPWIRTYTTIWTDTIRDGAFGLSNTNKLIRFYPGATGLKTGYTSSAGHCLAATAERDGVEYIAVVLHCASSADRFESAKTLLSYAFGGYTLVSVQPDEVLPPIPVTLGRAELVQPLPRGQERLLMKKSDAGRLEKAVRLVSETTAPVEEGAVLGTLTLSLDGEELVKVPLVAAEGVERLGWPDLFRELLALFF